MKMAKVTIAADSEIPFLDLLLPADKVDLIRFSSDMPPKDFASNADAIFIRTVSKINPQTFPERGRTKLLASASAGFDHADTDHLEKIDVRFAWAPGCNANAVGEYVATVILIWCDHYHINPSSLSLGIIGCGFTGTAVREIMARFGLQITVYDPPLQHRDSDFQSATLDEVLNCDILSFHVPLTHSGVHSTYHWLDSSKFFNRTFSLIVNASRGGVVDEKALSDAMDAGSVQDYIADVWENEPVVNDDTASRTFLCSPHIAGYSVQAKFNASLMICRQAAGFFGFDLCEYNEPSAGGMPEIIMAETLGQLLLQLHPVGKYHDSMRKLSKADEHLKGKLFGNLRNSVPLRDEYPYLRMPTPLVNRWPELKLLCGGKE
jgi:erythronate-4-phosphate dehydrogenase